MVSRSQLDSYAVSSDALRKSAQKAVHNQLAVYLEKNKHASVAEVREWAKALMQELCESYSISADALCADFFEELTGEPASGGAGGAYDYVDRDAIDRAVRYQAAKLSNGNTAGFVEGCARYLGEIAVNKRLNRAMITQVVGSSKRGRQSKGKGGIRWFRVPGGPEPCTFCVMLASRKDGYLTEESAGGVDPDHFHSGCKCKVVPARSADEIEGFDPGEYLAIYERFKEIDSYGLPRVQEEALKYAHLDRVRPQGGRVQQTQEELVEALEKARVNAWKSFAKEKTPASYENTVVRFVKLLGEEYGCSLECESYANDRGTVVYANPSGDELWIATRTVATEKKMTFLAQDRSFVSDVMTTSGVAEFKAPRSIGKVSRRLAHASEQIAASGGVEGSVYLSTLYLGDEEARAIEIAERFVSNGTLPTINVIDRAGRPMPLKKKDAGLGS